MNCTLKPILAILVMIPLCLPEAALSQTNEPGPKRMYGRVVDSITYKPVSDVHIWSERSGVITDGDGMFSLIVRPDDAIHFSHINYHTSILRCDSIVLRNEITIALSARVQLLDEVSVPAFYSEDSFKQKVLGTTPAVSREQQYANENAEMMKGLGKYAPPPPKTNVEIFFESLEGPKGATILSTRPDRGLIHAIKEMVNPSKPPVRSSSSEEPLPESINPFKVRLQLRQQLIR